MSTRRRSHYVLAVGQHDPAEHGDQIGLGVEYRGLPGRNLVFLRHDHIAACFQSLDRGAAGGTRRRRLQRRRRFGRALRAQRRLRTGRVKRDQDLRRHSRVALYKLHIAGEGRLLFLVAHLKRSRLDPDRLVPVLRKPLHGVRDRTLRSGPVAGTKDEGKDDRRRRMCDAMVEIAGHSDKMFGHAFIVTKKSI